jgi:uncharacterized protein YutE (UPF0331/DUF86 family)
MTNVGLVERKLGVVLDHLARLRTRRPAALESFRGDLLLQDAVSMSLLVVVQEALDIALHIASDEQWEMAPTYREAFVVLAKHGVLEAELASELGKTAQLRNRIAHGYATLDVERLWGELPAGIAGFEAFTKAVAVFLTASR